MRSFVASALAIATGIFVFAVGAGLTGSWILAGIVAALGAALVGHLVWRRGWVVLDETASSRGLKIVAGAGTIVALLQLGRLAVFMVAPARVDYSVLPSSQWEIHHSCVSAYFVAAEAAADVANLYDNALYSSEDNPLLPRKPRMLGPFKLDVYEYPPPFLALPRALRLVVPDFIRFRALWFGLNAGVVLLAMLVAARSLGPRAGTRALLFSPLAWAAYPTLSYLQKGNLQGLVIALSMLAMVLFERRRWAAGGALLAFATASKLFPGLLIAYLLARRQWQAVAWTAAMSGALVVVTLLDLGWAPYRAFFGHLPGLVGGEAFPAFRIPAAMAINYSVPGIVFKLKLFGVSGMAFGAAKIVGWVYTALAVGATVFAGRRVVRNDREPLVWMAILILATLRSPFLPQAYAAFPPLWLLTLLAATYPPTSRVLGWTLAAWLAFNIYWPLDWPLDPRWLSLLTLLPQGLTIVVTVLALRRSIVAGRPESPQPEATAIDTSSMPA